MENNIERSWEKDFDDKCIVNKFGECKYWKFEDRGKDEEPFNTGTDKFFPEEIKDFIKTVESQAERRIVERVRKEIESVEECMSVKDDDTHRYQIPRSKKADWDKFCDIPSSDEASWDVPNWAERIDGMPIISTKESILKLPSLNISNNAS